MRVLIGICRGVAIFFLIIIIFIFQINYALLNTFLSAGYFRQVFEKSGAPEFIARAVAERIEDAGSAPEKARGDENDLVLEIKKALIRSFDEHWLKTELSKFFTDSYSYLAGEAEKLPDINIDAIKYNFVKILADDATERNRAAGNAISRDKAETEIKKQFKIDAVKDVIDLNYLAFKLFGNNVQNPAAAAREMVIAYKQAVLIAIALPFVFILLVLAATSRTERHFARMAAVGFIGGGLSGLVPGIAGSSLVGLKRLLDYFHSTPVFIDDALDIISIHPFLKVFLCGFFNMLAVQGSIILISGILLFVLSRFINDISAMNICPRTAAFAGNERAARLLNAPVFKAAAVLLLGAAFYLALQPQLHILAGKAENIKKSVQASKNFRGNADLLGAIAETTGADFLNDVDWTVNATIKATEE